MNHIINKEGYMYHNRFLAGVVAVLWLVVILWGIKPPDAVGEVIAQDADMGVLLTVMKDGTGDGSVTASSGTITWNGTTGTASYAINTEVTLTAVAGMGSRFNGWVGCNTTTDTLCKVTMSKAMSVIVDFKTVTKKTKKDFNNDNKSDIILQSSSTRDVAVWLMDGAKKAKADYAAKGVPENWVVKTAEDFNGDRKADVMWQNTETGDVYIWLMDGTSATSGAYASTGITSDWQIKAVGDFDGDARNDVLWQNTQTGAVYVWLMDGNTQKSGGYVVKSMQPQWQIKGTGDFDDDDNFDVLLQNQNTGDVYVWLMDGTSIKKGDYISRGVPGDWQVRAVADYNGDGKADIHWEDSKNKGSFYVWLMDGTDIKGGDFVKPKGGSSHEFQHKFRQMTENSSGSGTWDMKSVGDYNGDGMNDMLWQDGSTGDLYMWFMDSTTVDSGGYADQGLPMDWSIY
ncbi:FG-GAP repeat-containing protein [Candidatus Magnetobacterium bavaricum]|uniref:FG-GAP repeat-containing protein n=1 Tax=Candidatus Magnetobacterium bavaricum TaxID=29290 RepID=A0A0F3GMR1_9BACT|nr:FG-GAP repeat-containing protein [Candidatus Magnetobacterium bavaricum]